MSSKTITFRMPEEKLLALDSIAEFEQRDRSFILNEAINQYLSLQQYYREQILEGIRQADAGEVVPHEVVVREMEERIAAKATARASEQQL